MVKTKSNIDVKGDNLFLNLSIIFRACAFRLDSQHRFLKKTCFQLFKDLKEIHDEYRIVKKPKTKLKK